MFDSFLIAVVTEVQRVWLSLGGGVMSMALSALAFWLTQRAVRLGKAGDADQSEFPFLFWMEIWGFRFIGLLWLLAGIWMFVDGIMRLFTLFNGGN